MSAYPRTLRNGTRRRGLAVFGAGFLLLLMGVVPAAAPPAVRPSVGVETTSFRLSQLELGSGAERPNAVPTIQAQARSTDAWGSWNDLPRLAPAEGYLVPKARAVGGLSPDSFPGIVIRKGKNADGAGPPRSLDILNPSTNVLHNEAVKALLIGPDRQLFAEYAKSPDTSLTLNRGVVAFSNGRNIVPSFVFLS